MVDKDSGAKVRLEDYYDSSELMVDTDVQTLVKPLLAELEYHWKIEFNNARLSSIDASYFTFQATTVDGLKVRTSKKAVRKRASDFFLLLYLVALEKVAVRLVQDKLMAE